MKTNVMKTFRSISILLSKTDPSLNSLFRQQFLTDPRRGRKQHPFYTRHVSDRASAAGFETSSSYG